MQREEANLAFFHFLLPCLELPGINIHVTSIAAHFQISVLSNNFCLLYAQKFNCNKFHKLRMRKLRVQFRSCWWLDTFSYTKLYITYHWQKCWGPTKRPQISSTCKTWKNGFIHTLCIKHPNPCEIPGEQGTQLGTGRPQCLFLACEWDGKNVVAASLQYAFSHILSPSTQLYSPFLLAPGTPADTYTLSNLTGHIFTRRGFPLKPDSAI